jgi:2-aminoadipate transaminase
MHDVGADHWCFEHPDGNMRLQMVTCGYTCLQTQIKELAMVQTADVQRWERALATRTHGGAGEGLASILSLSNASGIISFAGGFPDPSIFPGEVLADLLREMLISGDPSALQYAPVEGLPGPRAYVADRLEGSEGHRPGEDELLITSGAVEALELLGKAFLNPGDAVLVEAPTYLGAIMAFESFQAQVMPVPMGDQGLEVESARRIVEQGLRPKMLYTIPDYQNPTGATMSLDRRHALVEVARRHGFLIIEDVAYRELGFGAERLPSLWSLGPDTVVQVGTFSKTFFPGVRLGWAAGPPPVIAWMRWAKQNTDQCAGALGQRLLEAYGRRGLMEQQNIRARELYGRRCRALMAGLDAEMPDGVEWTRPTGGFFSWLTLPPGSDSLELGRRAVEMRVAFVPGLPFFPDGRGRRNIRLAFSRVLDEDIPEGAVRLGQLFREALGGKS